MSVAGYLSAGGELPRMSRRAAGEVGARFEGAVMQGELSLRERLGRDAVTVGGEYYGDVEEYDEVVLAHCGKH